MRRSRWRSRPAVRRRGSEGVTLYHATTREAAASIVRDGFRDPDPFAPRTEFAGQVGIWLSDAPKSSVNNVAQGDSLLEVRFELSEKELAEWEDLESDPEWAGGTVHLPLPGYREWCIPADLVNRLGSVRLLGEAEADEVRLAWGWAPKDA